MLVYLVPPARSRYCASPEASIMRLKDAAKLGATASAPTSAALINCSTNKQLRSTIPPTEGRQLSTKH
jgi:hypothetical protein